MLKRCFLISILVAVLLNFGVMPVSAAETDFLAEGVCGENLTWRVTKEYVLEISGIEEMENYSLATMVPWDEYSDSIVSVVIGSGVTSIGKNAFYGFEKLESVTIADSVTRIGESAFENSAALTEIKLSNNLEQIDRKAFYNCSSLTGITLPATLNEIADYTFSKCTALKSIQIPESVVSIGYYSFMGCSALENVTLKEGLSQIGMLSFHQCSALKEISIPDSVEAIGSGAFAGCTSMTQVTIGDGVTTVGSGMFSDCGNLNQITVSSGNNVLSVDQYGALIVNGNTLNQLPGGYVGEYTAPNTIVKVDDGAFSGCSKLTQITFPDSLKTIGSQVFFDCDQLSEVIFPGELPEFDYESLQELTADCYYPAGMYDWESFLENNLDVRVLSEAEDSDEEYYYHERTWKWICFKTGTGGAYDYPVDSGTCGNSAAWYLTNDGVLTISGTGSTKSYPNNDAPWKNQKISHLVVEDGITSVFVSGFGSDLNRVSLPKTLLTIGSGIFKNCSSLTEIDIPDHVEVIEAEAFYNTGLKEVTFPESIKSIGGDTFGECSDLKLIRFEGACPRFSPSVFNNVVATAYYPWDDSSWQSDALDNYGGTITWVKDGVASIIAQPKTQTVTIGAQAVFSIDVSGTGNSYQWQYKTGSSSSWKNCTADGNQTEKMYVPATTGRNSYYYRCKITASGGSVIYSDAVRLYVLGVTKQPAPQVVKTGNNAVFSVSATGLNKTYQWQYKPSDGTDWKNCSATGNKSATMTVSATTLKNANYYRCKITDSSGNVVYTNTVRLYVLGITKQPATQIVKTGNGAVFSVSATGLNNTYQWQYKPSDGNTWKNSSASGCKSATMTVPATTLKNANYYRCKITDSSGNVAYTKTVRLYVLGITAQPKAKNVRIGDTVTFNIQATGKGVTYQWQYLTKSGGTWQNCTATGNKTSTMSVPATSGRNGYSYRCKLSDSEGNVLYSNAVKLSVFGIVSQSGSASVKKDAVAKFTVKASGDGLTYRWEYRSKSSSDWANATASGNRSSQLSVPGSTWRNGYQYRCRITDKYGKVVYSNPVTLKIV